MRSLSRSDRPYFVSGVFFPLKSRHVKPPREIMSRIGRISPSSFRTIWAMKKVPWLFRVYRGWHPTHLCGDYRKPLAGSVTNQDSMESIRRFFSRLVAQMFLSFGVSNFNLWNLVLVWSEIFIEFCDDRRAPKRWPMLPLPLRKAESIVLVFPYGFLEFPPRDFPKIL